MAPQLRSIELTMLDGRDDVEALSRVLEGLSQELQQQRERINEVCQVADQIGGIEPLDNEHLQKLLDQESELAIGSIKALGTAEGELEKVMALIRSYSRVQEVQRLSMVKECSDELTQLTEKTNNEYMELLELQNQCVDLDRKLGKVAAYLS